jgi:arginyl-tRNA synthetase
MKDYLYPVIQSALGTIGAPEETEIVLESPRQPEHGDLATSVAMGLARALKKSPRQIAEAIVGAIEPDSRFLSAIEIAGPGFINFRFTPAFYQMRLEEIAALGESYGRSDIGGGIKTNVEYVSANPTGPLHTGHNRGAALGDTIANLLEWTGHDVTREYYFNNAGNQMRNLALSIRARYLEILGRTVEFPENGYHGEYISEIARSIFEKHGDTLAEDTEENLATIQKLGESWNFAHIKATLDRLGIDHDVYFNESSLYASGEITDTIEELKRLGKAYEKDGALWLSLEEQGLQDRVIVKSTGEPTYRLPDIAYHRNKFARGFELIVDIFGADHIATAQDVKAALRMLGYDDSKVKVVLNQMVTFIEGGEPVKMSKRTGRSLTLDALIEELGADVVRFFFIMRGVNTQLEFDLDLAREQSAKNPVYYLQYAFARTAGVLRHAASEGVEFNPTASLAPLVHDEELGLIKQLLFFPEMIRRSARELEPQIVAEYLREVAEAYHKFQHECRIIGAETEALRDARLRLLAATRMVLGNGLRLLGISTPDRM